VRTIPRSVMHAWEVRKQRSMVAHLPGQHDQQDHAPNKGGASEKMPKPALPSLDARFEREVHRTQINRCCVGELTGWEQPSSTTTFGFDFISGPTGWMSDDTVGRINDALRSGQQPKDPRDLELAQAIKEAMTPSLEEAVLYRGIALSSPPEVGATIKDGGIVAATPRLDAAEEFALARTGRHSEIVNTDMMTRLFPEKDAYVMEMLLPQGTRGTIVDDDFEALVDDGDYRVVSVTPPEHVGTAGDKAAEGELDSTYLPGRISVVRE
jgi:hypothetical protein